MRGAGLDRRFVDYIRGMYDASETFIQVRGQNSRAFSPKKGVRQGDPLSPLLFNMVLDLGLRAIPQEVNYTLGTARVNALAFADVILVATTPQVLRLACETFTSSLRNAGLRINPMKSATLTLVPSGRDHKLKVYREIYSVDGGDIPALEVSALWRYLGIGIAGGRLNEYNACTYTDALGRISAAPMRPQFKLCLARDYPDTTADSRPDVFDLDGKTVGNV